MDGINTATTRLDLNIPLFSYGDPTRPMTVNLRGSFPSTWSPDDPLSLNIVPYDMVTYPAHHDHNIVTPIGTSEVVPVVAFSQNNGDGSSFYYSQEGGGSAIRSHTSNWVDVWQYINGNGDIASSSTINVAIFNAGSAETSISYYNKIEFSDGETWTYYYNVGPAGSRPKFIVSNRGYGIQISYQSDATNGNLWDRIASLTFYNKAYVYCNETALVDCANVSVLKTRATITSAVSGATTILTIAPPASSGQKLSVVTANDGLRDYYDVPSVETVGIPGSTRTYQYLHQSSGNGGYDGDPIVYDVADFVTSSSNALATHVYANGASSGTWAGSPDGAGISINSQGQMDSFGYREPYPGPSFQWTRTFDTHGRLWTQTSPLGDKYTFVRDDRGNATSLTHSTSGLPSITSTATFPTTCSNVKTCNKATAAIDGKGVETDYTFSPDNGAVLTATGPADANGIRPQKRYTYVQRYAWILNGSGGYMQASSPIWLPATESYCRNSAATGNPSAPCAGNDEVKTTYEYGADAGPNNLFLRGKAVSADGQTLRTCYAYNPQGRKISETQPRAGLTSCS